MAFVKVPKPGSKFLCAGSCNHLDCADHRATAETLCLRCRKPIGYDIPFAYHSLDDLPAHWECINKDA